MKVNIRDQKKTLFTYGILIVIGLSALLYIGLQKTSPLPTTEPSLRLLSESQYRSAIHQIFGDHIEIPAGFPPIPRIDGMLARGASAVSVTPGLIDKYYRVGKQVAQQVFSLENRNFYLSCNPDFDDVDLKMCAKIFFEEAGLLIYRRPLESEEIIELVSLVEVSEKNNVDFISSMRLALTAMLVAPQFLLIKDTFTEEKNGQPTKLDDYSRATRLSLFLWNSVPDKTLLESARNGELRTKVGIKSQVERMLNDSRYTDGVTGFFSDFFRLDELDYVAKDQTIYPAFAPVVSEYAKAETLKMIQENVIEGLDYRDLYTTETTYLNADLAQLYRIPFSSHTEFQRVEMDPGERSGLLTRSAFLSMTSHPGRSSPTLRGQGLREAVLCQNVPPPPPNVDFSNFEDQAGEFSTARERLTRHSSDPACANCHKITDPIGLALENYDGAGQFRVRENGVVIDTSGELDGITFKTPEGLGEAVKANPATVSCLIERLYSYALSKMVRVDDVPLLTSIEKRFVDNGYRVKEIMEEIATSDYFFNITPAGDSSDI